MTDVFKWKYQPRTQKGRGIEWLDTHSLILPTNKHVFFPASFNHDVKESYNFPLFVRPCPEKPRHGFVDSRLVHDLYGLRTVVDETRKAENGAEIGLCKRLDAEASAVLANNILTLGPGNDGATAGHSDCVELPIVQPELVDTIPKNIVADDEAPFFELVYTRNSIIPTLVQLRSGPRIAMSRDFIPADTTVATILEGDEDCDLLEWEKIVEDAGPGTVIHTSTMSCHYAIHGVINNVPVITTHMPALGEVLEKNTGATPKIDPDDFRNGFTSAFNVTDRDNPGDIDAYLRGWFKTTLGILHNAAPIIQAGRGWLLGYASGLFVNIVYALSYGELSHWKGGTTDWTDMDYGNIYRRTIKESTVDSIVDNLIFAYEKFMDTQWSASFGGPKWGDVVTGAIDVINAISGSPEGCVAALNRAVNKEHNNGWFLNKIFDSKLVMNNASKNSGLFVIRNGRGIYNTIAAAGEPDCSYEPQTVNMDEINAGIEAETGVTIVKENGNVASSIVWTVRGNNDPNFFLQVRKDHTTYKLQIEYYGMHAEWNVSDELLTKQGAKLVDRTAGEISKSLYNSGVLYNKLVLRGKKGKWFCIDNKRVISLSVVASTFNTAFGKHLKVING